MLGQKRWLFVDLDEQVETDFANHGTCVASLVAGPTFGAAKKANIVTVRVPPIPLAWDLIEALILITDDVIKNKLQVKAVLNLSMRGKLNEGFSFGIMY